jgi:hypothetical protein
LRNFTACRPVATVECGGVFTRSSHSLVSNSETALRPFPQPARQIGLFNTARGGLKAEGQKRILLHCGATYMIASVPLREANKPSDSAQPFRKLPLQSKYLNTNISSMKYLVRNSL